MKVPLKPRWKAKVLAIKPRIYPLENEACQLVYETFDKIYHLDRLKFTTAHIPFRFLVFNLWKIDAEEKKKGKVVVNLQKLNKMVLSDSYLLPLQLEIIANV